MYNNACLPCTTYQNLTCLFMLSSCMLLPYKISDFGMFCFYCINHAPRESRIQMQVENQTTTTCVPWEIGNWIWTHKPPHNQNSKHRYLHVQSLSYENLHARSRCTVQLIAKKDSHCKYSELKQWKYTCNNSKQKRAHVEIESIPQHFHAIPCSILLTMYWVSRRILMQKHPHWFYWCWAWQIP